MYSLVVECGKTSMRTFPPVSPYQLLERVDTDVVGVHALDLDTALLQVLFVNLVRVPSPTGEKQHYH